jgi:O-acetyl-ADP-ribose deacetylase (regulator of RNase III)
MAWRVTVLVGDPLHTPGDALVRPVTGALEGITPWSRQVEVEGGARLSQRLAAQDGLPAGAVLVTPAGELPFDLLLHAVLLTPDEGVGRGGLLRALRNVLRQAGEWEVRVLVLPLLGTGAGQLSLEEAVEVLADALPELDGPSTAQATGPRAADLEVRIPAAGAMEAEVIRETLARIFPGRVSVPENSGEAGP